MNVRKPLLEQIKPTKAGAVLWDVPAPTAVNAMRAGKKIDPFVSPPLIKQEGIGEVTPQPGPSWVSRHVVIVRRRVQERKEAGPLFRPRDRPLKTRLPEPMPERGSSVAGTALKLHGVAVAEKPCMERQEFHVPVPP